MTHSKLRLCSVLGEKTELLPHFIRHYRELGVEEFDFVLHLLTPDAPFREEAMDVLADYGIEPAELLIGQWNGYRGTQYLNTVKARHPEAWFVVADSDEFHLYPDALPQIIAYAEQQDQDFVTGCLLDRISQTGELTPVISDSSIWAQFPVAGFISFPMMGANPFKITLCRGKAKLSEGQHGIVIEGKEHPVWNDVVAQVHHFKWTADLAERMQVRIDNIAAGHWEDAFKGYGEETQRMLVYLARLNGQFSLSEPRFLLGEAGSDYGDYTHWNEVLRRVSSWSFLQASPKIYTAGAGGVDFGLDIK